MIEIFKNQTVLITGHTGFKGSWLSLILKYLGANLIGVSNNVVTKPSHYENIKDIFSHDLRANIEEKDSFSSILKKYRPKFIFHLAAQAIVSTSFEDPYQTFASNTIGTLNLVEALRLDPFPCTAILITSDKAYKNLEIDRGYHEEDILGGIDPYSSSKGAAELIIQTYFKTFFSNSIDINIGVARAGNVVGGGDWSANRLIPDAIRAWISHESLLIRNPESTRPWQHILDPLYGYISLAQYLSKQQIPNGSVFNFGPNVTKSATVKKVAICLQNNLPNFSWHKDEDAKIFFESKLLALDCTKAERLLDWNTILTLDEVIEWTALWYLNFYSKSPNEISNFSFNQIQKYFDKVKK
tara:strand:+ start:10563 stop:11627 length:1065 start_codon:yes stop_codon:yes gene_type:complete